MEVTPESRSDSRESVAKREKRLGIKDNIGVTAVGSRTAVEGQFQQDLLRSINNIFQIVFLKAGRLEDPSIDSHPPSVESDEGVFVSHHLHFKDAVVQWLQWAPWLLRGYWGRKSMLKVDPVSIRSACTPRNGQH